MALLLIWGALSSRAPAQQPATGFAVERFSPSAPGAGWLVMDALDMQGGLGGAMALDLGYAMGPLRVGDGAQQLAVVSDQAFAGIGVALTYRRWRFSLQLDTPIAIKGQSGRVGGYSFTAPSVDFGASPDTLLDPRLGVEVRIVGRPGGRFRLGLGAQLIFPNGNRADYASDGTFRGTARVLIAGDVGLFTYAGHLGVQIRPLDDALTPGSPRGSELLFGFAGGVKLPISRHGLAVVLGPEIFGATAFRSFFSSSTALEGLLSARLEGTHEDKLQLRVKLGIGGELNPSGSVPEWRVVVGVEAFVRRRP